MSKASEAKPASKTIKLEYPISWGEETISEIEIKRPKGKHMRKLGGNVTMDEMLEIAQKCSAQPKSVFDEMDGQDVLKVAEVIGDFLGSGQKTGEPV